MALTREQEAALAAIADREIAAAPVREALAQAELEMAEVDARFFADRAAEEQKLNESIAAINQSYAVERSAKIIALAEAKRAIESIINVAI